MTRIEDVASAPNLPPGPPPAPRLLTAQSARRAWFEPHVRFWWLLAAVMLLLTAGLLVDAMLTQHAEDRLFVHGTRVNATVLGGLKGQRVAPDTPVDLGFTLNGTPVTVNGLLEGRTDYIDRGSTVPLLVDPTDPNHWTYRTIGPPFVSQLVAPGIAAVGFLIAAVVALLERARVVTALVSGEAWLARVVSVSTSALAPLAKQARVVPADAKQKRVLSVFVPGLLGRNLRPGELIWLVSSKARAGRTVTLSADQQVPDRSRGASTEGDVRVS